MNPNFSSSLSSPPPQPPPCVVFVIPRNIFKTWQINNFITNFIMNLENVIVTALFESLFIPPANLGDISHPFTKARRIVANYIVYVLRRTFPLIATQFLSNEDSPRTLSKGPAITLYTRYCVYRPSQPASQSSSRRCLTGICVVW